MVLYGIPKTLLVNLGKGQKENGMAFRRKSIEGCNKRAITYNQPIAIHSFLSNFAEEKGSKLPGRVKGKLKLFSFLFQIILFPPPLPLFLPLLYPSHFDCANILVQLNV